eukprot:Amastigsp_a677057_49.p2 type:complete len:213 gc:universal Amastigsp_a677057_49:727-89(-)
MAGHWEWRVFARSLELPAALVDADPERGRADEYFVVGARGVGLKARDVSPGDRDLHYELKVRVAKRKHGELWVKHDLGHGRRASGPRLARMLEPYRELSKGVAKAIAALEQMDVVPTLALAKERRAGKIERGVKIEHTRLRVGASGSKWHTVCVEAASYDVLKGHVRSVADAIGASALCGYPEFVEGCRDAESAASSAHASSSSASASATSD